ncbi:hypothetical protein [Tateyamaria omphalii]|uniref:Alginate biosynthesis protein Alg44 n=1 Tax=Tateyamaria omphalii TaxID=299262 RepID=A0A1P8N1U4_9RHOB|nr:hypothetical protein [Tateyamaria omphalii]APX14284.1 hypothetical protein BWR18_20765 [Tateyamaria omphalii]
MNDATNPSDTPIVPVGFGLESEHPMLTMPFTLSVAGQTFEGKRISVTEIEIALPKGTMNAGSKELAKLSFPFEDFTITLMAQVTATDRGDDNMSILLFSEPTGAHLAQLRYVINSVIAGDIITLKGLMAYTGPTQPKSPKAAEAKSNRDRLRSIGVALVSLFIAFVAGTAVFSRYTTAYEMHPVFIDRTGLAMQATVAGQLTYLNPEAAPGEVAYTIAATTGDVLSFQMPRNGQVALSSDVFEGSTVLPTDLILTIFDNSDSIRLRTLISIEGLTRALQGDPATIEMNDGRTLPVTVQVRDTTRAAALRGDLFVPVDLTVKGGSLGPSDMNKSARLRLSKTLLGVFGIGQENGQ